ncbi:UDP-forming cellulose synthase catalytic subunit [Methylobacterium sp. J-068]|uniref:UDP-forming cellulose synthase catalytic subunit n=1 Tax=Methylobacterium sp. J-068 TaxID=2836649 RepID=UPI001FBB7A0E|nr:UDP-forming cellulose synthase catalytic subunit [Methylobacterium sp. J-068]MCJ2032793.1 UDP-forming cellulose synthase catalytic subunit [Methylobacterium sp. J-068]
MGLIWTTWSVSAALALGYLAQPVGTGAQLALCAGAGAGMVGLWLFCPKHGWSRMAFLALGSLVVVRYVYWRLSGTLPGLDDPIGLGLGLVLVAAELYCVLILSVSLIINADPLERAEAPAQPDAALPSIDVLVPSYNESTEILAVTLAASLNLDYPADKLTVWLLDDGGTDQKCFDADVGKAEAARTRRAALQALCRALGARYLTRERNEHAKAGNLNNGLKASSAEIVLVLDADHAPFRSFLRETVGLFSTDPRLFLVQTPHVFLNPDPVERNLRTFGRMPSENEMFYAITQRGLDKWNGSFFCGSAALLRREALDAVNGFSGITITEDCETAFELHARGWTSAFVDKPLIAGLQPETFADFIGQRTRWCQGMFQIMLLKNPLTKAGLKPIQRLGYLSSMAYWFFPLPRLIFMLAPLLHIFFDVKMFVSSLDEALAFTATYVVANMMIQNYLYGRVRWPWISELYEYVQGVHLARAIVSVLVSPRTPGFNVTAKGVSLETDHLSPLSWPFFAIFGALAAGCATATWRYLYEPGVTSLMLVVGLWCLFNLVIAGVALGVVAERRQPERCPSLPVSRRGRVAIGGQSFAVEVQRASSDGCTLRRADGAPWPAAVTDLGTLDLQPRRDGAALAPLPFRPRAAAKGEVCPVAFEAMHSGTYRTLAELMYGDAAPLRDFLQGRRRHKTLLGGSLRFLAWGITEPVRAFGCAARAARAARPAAIAGPVVAVAPSVAAVVEPVVIVPVVAMETAPGPSLAARSGREALNEAPRAIDPVAVSEIPVPEPASAPAPVPPVTPMTAEAWQAAMRALLGEAPPAPRLIVTGLDPAAWKACVEALADAELTKSERPETSPAMWPAMPPEPVRAFEGAAPDTLAERRDPLSRGHTLRNAA